MPKKIPHANNGNERNTLISICGHRNVLLLHFGTAYILMQLMELKEKKGWLLSSIFLAIAASGTSVQVVEIDGGKPKTLLLL